MEARALRQDYRHKQLITARISINTARMIRVLVLAALAVVCLAAEAELLPSQVLEASITSSVSGLQQAVKGGESIGEILRGSNHLSGLFSAPHHTQWGDERKGERRRLGRKIGEEE